LLTETAAPAVHDIECQLSHADARIRSCAAWALGQVGEGARGAVPSLRIVLASDPSADVRLSAIEAIGMLGPVAGISSPEVFQALADPDPCVRRAAPAALARLGNAAANEVAVLVGQLGDERIDVWSEAAWALEGMAEVGAPVLAQLLTSEQSILRVRSTMVLANMAIHHPNYVPVLAERLDDPDVGVRALVARAIAGVGTSDLAYCAGLARRLRLDTGEVKHRAATALWAILSAALKQDFKAKEKRRMRGSVEELQRGGELGATTLASRLGSDDGSFWRSAAHSLMEMGAVGAAALAKLLLPSERNLLVRTRAAWALGEMAQMALPHADVLAACLADSEPEVRDSAAWALLRLASVERLQASTPEPHRDEGVWQKAVLPLRELGSRGTDILAARTCNNSSEVQNVASDALKLTGDSGAAALASMLGSRDEEVRRRAVMLLGRMGAVSAPYSGMVMRLLTDRQLAVQRSAASALGDIGPSAAQHMGRLLLKLKDSDAILRGNALEALKELRGAVHPHLAVIASLLEDVDARVRRIALEIFFTSGRLGAVFLENIAMLLSDAEAQVRWTAAEALGRFGPAATSQASSLANSLGDSNVHVRQKAAWALHQLGEAAAAPYIDSFTRLLTDPAEAVRSQAVVCLQALGNIGVQQVVSLLHSDDVKTRRLAAEASGRLHFGSASHAEALAGCLADEDLGVRIAAAEALKRHSLAEDTIAHEPRWPSSSLSELRVKHDKVNQPVTQPNMSFPAHHVAGGSQDAANYQSRDDESTAKQAARLAIAASRHEPDSTVRGNAAAALRSIGDAAEPAASALTATFRGDGDTWLDAAEQICLMGDAGAHALARRLNDINPDVRRRAALALGRVPSFAASHAGLLRALTLDQDAGVRRSAAWALEESGLGAGSFPEAF